MKRIRTNTRIDRLANDQRASPIRWGRRIYFAILTGLGLFALNWAVGDVFILRADGLVVADRSIAGATYVARVAKVLVREGQHVQAGDVVVELESPEMLSEIARVASQNADLALREVQLHTRAIALATLLPLAERHAQESDSVVAKLANMTVSGLVSSERFGQALASQYAAAARLVELRAEATMLATDLPTTTNARMRATETFQRLEAFYDQGQIRAARSGTVGTRIPASGQVVKIGDELLQVYAGETSVLAYLPDSYLFGLKKEDRVELTGGQERTDGVVEALLEVTDALPPEFQSNFRPRDRSRLVRIRLAGEPRFAISQKVQVRGCAFGWCGTYPSSASLLTSLQRLFSSKAVAGTFTMPPL